MYVKIRASLYSSLRGKNSGATTATGEKKPNPSGQQGRAKEEAWSGRDSAEAGASAGQAGVSLHRCYHRRRRCYYYYCLCEPVSGALPKLTRVRATHRTSATSAGRMRALLRTSPYLIWKGSIMVRYLFSLIGLAKKKPPGRASCRGSHNTTLHKDQCSGLLKTVCKVLRPLHTAREPPSQGCENKNDVILFSQPWLGVVYTSSGANFVLAPCHRELLCDWSI